MFLKQCKRFLVLGFVNFLLTNLILQILLLTKNVWLATSSSQLVNLIIGYYLYNYFVFNSKKLSKRTFSLYICLAFVSWNLNTYLIFSFSNYFKISNNLAAFLNIPLLTVFSFIVQKYIIFRTKNKF